MAKASWLNISQSSGTGNATVDVSLPPHTGRKERSSVLTFRGLNTSDVQCSVIQDGKKAFIDIESEVAINENGEEVTIVGTSNSARLTFSFGDGNLTNISLPETYMVNSVSTQNGNAISGDLGATEEYSFSISMTIPANEDTIIKTREVVVEDEAGNKGICVLSLSAQKKLYTDIEYIESTGTQYIDTGLDKVLFSNSDKIYVGVRPTYVSSALFFFGCMVGSRGFGLRTRNTTWIQATIWQKGGPEGSNVDTIYQRFDIELSKTDGFILNGTQQATAGDGHPTLTSMTDFPLFIGAYTSATGQAATEYTVTNTKLRCYYLRVERREEIILDLIPVLDLNGVACMYDKISKTFFYNQGSGNFVTGNPI